MADWYVFWVIAPISVVSGVAMILARNAVHCALLLIVNFFTLAVFFLILGSPFLFVVQIIVYAGAIMVLFLFVIMLLGVDQTESLTERLIAQRWLAALLGAGLVAEVVTAVWLGLGVSRQRLPDFTRVNQGGNVQALARVLFGPYFFPFEVTSILLIVAAIGAMLHGRRRIDLEPTIDRAEDYRPQEPAYGERTAVPGGEG
ncbi:MAG TPA: NADH-quinone oxidoreductase subunit J [Actinomycetota bacterium]